MPAVAPGAGVRAVGRWPATCSATRPRWPSTRSARPLREARAAIEAAVGRRRAGRRRCSAGCAPRSSRAARPLLRRAAQRRLRRPPRGQHRGAARVAAALRHRRRCRSTPTRSSTARSARPSVRGRGPHRRAHPGHRGADPADRRDQAPGQDGHRRHLPLRRERCSQVPLVQAVLDGRAPAATGSRYRTLRTLADLDPAVDGGHRASPATASRATRRGGDATIDGRRPGRHRARPRRRAPSATRGCGARSTGSRVEREVLGGAGPQRRPHRA